MTRFVAWYPSIAADPRRYAHVDLSDAKLIQAIESYPPIQIGEHDGAAEAMPTDWESREHFRYMDFCACAEGASEEEAWANALAAAQAERTFIESRL